MILHVGYKAHNSGQDRGAERSASAPRSGSVTSSLPTPPHQPRNKASPTGTRALQSASPAVGYSNGSQLFGGSFGASGGYSNGLRRTASPAQRSASPSTSSMQRALSAATTRSPSAGTAKNIKRKCSHQIRHSTSLHHPLTCLYVLIGCTDKVPVHRHLVLCGLPNF